MTKAHCQDWKRNLYRVLFAAMACEWQYPIHTALLIMNFLASIAAFMLGTYLFYIHQKGATMEELLAELSEIGIDVDGKERMLLKDPDTLSNKEPIHSLKVIGLVLGLLCFLFAAYLLKRAFDVMVILCGKGVPVLERYRNCMGRDYLRCIKASTNPVTYARNENEMSELEKELNSAEDFRTPYGKKGSKEDDEEGSTGQQKGSRGKDKSRSRKRSKVHLIQQSDSESAAGSGSPGSRKGKTPMQLEASVVTASRRSTRKRSKSDRQEETTK